MAVVLTDEAAIFVDGRYTVQVREQVDAAAFKPEHLIETPPETWLETHLQARARSSATTRRCTRPDGVEALRSAPAPRPARRSVAVDSNPIDADLDGPPRAAARRRSCCTRSNSPARTAASKLDRIRARLASSAPTRSSCPIRMPSPGPSTSAAPTSSHTPLPLGYAVVPREGRPSLFLDGAQALQRRARHARPPSPTCEEPGRARPRAAAARRGEGARALRPGHRLAAARRASSRPPAAAPISGSIPIALMKAAQERGRDRRHARRAPPRRRGHDAASWLARRAKRPRAALTEIDAAEALEEFRRATGVLKDVSFPTISGAGPNARASRITA